jgi:hypothetical protein
MKIRPVGAELFHADGQTEKHDELKATSCNFVNAHKKTKIILFYFVQCILLYDLGNGGGEGSCGAHGRENK